MFNLFVKVALTSSVILYSTFAKKAEEVHGYHFHTYFFEGVKQSSNEALVFHSAIETQIKNGFLKDCIVKAVNRGPFGPHNVGNFETCCNKTGISSALSFFMLNHGNLSVLFHPLTRYEKLDHTGREMFLGPRIPVSVDALAEDLLDFTDLCDSEEQGINLYKMKCSRVNACKTYQS